MFGLKLKIRYTIWLLTFIEANIALQQSSTKKTKPLGSQKPIPRVVHGWSDVKNEYPYVVSLETEKKMSGKFDHYRTCTGSLITSQWVVTAARCNVPVAKYIRYGDMETPRDLTKFLSKIIKHIPHPAYSRPQMPSPKKMIYEDVYPVKDDIGLLLVEDTPMKKYGQLHAADYKSFVGRACRYAGFGQTQPLSDRPGTHGDSEVTIKSLQVGEGAVWKDETSKVFRREDDNSWGPKITVVPKCMKKEQQPTLGDSGGPLLIDKQIAGVCSRVVVRTSAVNNFNFYYTPVSPYLDWITKKIDKYASANS